MQRKKQFILPLIMLVSCLLVHFWCNEPQRVEALYSIGIFPVIAAFLRLIFGWLPFSVGDIGYAAAVIFLLAKFVQLIRFIFRKNKVNSGEKVKQVSRSFFISACIIYLVFNIFWGINYNREGISAQLQLDMKKYSVEELKNMNGLLVQKVNESKLALLRSNKPYPDNAQLFSMTAAAYKNVSACYSFLRYDHVSLKSSMWGWVGNYTGFLGYYNPFTGEAQVNTTVPKFTQPFTACHETAHQLGYAKEMEANFVGYLAAAASSDTLFHYSVYTDLFLYANRSLYFADTAASSLYRNLLLPPVIEDFKERRKFNRDHTSIIEPAIRSLYGKFLESNQQPSGIMSYDEVTGFIIAYYRKFGKI